MFDIFFVCLLVSVMDVDVLVFVSTLYNRVHLFPQLTKPTFVVFEDFVNWFDSLRMLDAATTLYQMLR